MNLEALERALRDPATVERFWKKVDRSGGEDACWPWIGYRHQKGYGIVGIGGKLLKAHRVAFSLKFGPIPEGMCICHHCDNPPCCNAAHCFVGTNADNVRDRVSKNRTRVGHLHGVTNGMSKLTDEIVAEIRKSTGTLEQIAVEFGVSAPHVWAIRKGLHWSHTLDNPPQAYSPRPRINAELVIEIRAAVGSNAAIARQFGLSRRHIRNIRNRTAWAEIP